MGVGTVPATAGIADSSPVADTEAKKSLREIFKISSPLVYVKSLSTMGAKFPHSLHLVNSRTILWDIPFQMVDGLRCCGTRSTRSNALRKTVRKHGIEIQHPRNTARCRSIENAPSTQIKPVFMVICAEACFGRSRYHSFEVYSSGVIGIDRKRCEDHTLVRLWAGLEPRRHPVLAG